MMKRILVLMAITGSFAPLAYAIEAGGLMQQRVQLAHTGELGVNETDLRGSQCELQKDIAELDQEIRNDAAGIAAGAR